MPRPAMGRDRRFVDLLPATNPLIRKLSHCAPLSKLDKNVLHELATGDERFRADVDIPFEATPLRRAFLIKEGLAIRYRNMPSGSRQIMTFLIPGDLCDENVFLNPMDHSIATITPVCLSWIPRERMMNLFLHHPRISAALWWSALQEQAMLRERIVSLGRRDARGRVAYLLCELYWRYLSVGLAIDESFRLPLTQMELGDALGLSPVHVNRVLIDFRRESLISMGNGKVILLLICELQNIAGLGKGYLQLRDHEDYPKSKSAGR